MNSISDAKKPQLMAEETTREWLRHLSESTRPSNSQMQELIRAKHRQKMTVKYSNWPIGGHTKVDRRMAKNYGRMQDMVSLSVRNMDQRLQPCVGGSSRRKVPLQLDEDRSEERAHRPTERHRSSKMHGTRSQSGAECAPVEGHRSLKLPP